MNVAMNLKQTRLVTESVDRLTRFYEYVTGASATVLGSGYVEFQRSPCAGLAIADVATVRSYGAGGAEPAANRSAILDFEVDDVDAEYKRLKKHVSDWVQTPAQQPWGNRAMLFRHPDGNPINMLPTLALPSMYDAVHGAVSLFAGASSGTRSIGSVWLGFAPNLVFCLRSSRRLFAVLASIAILAPVARSD